MSERLISFFKSSPTFHKVAMTRFKESDSDNLRNFIFENESELLMEVIETLEMPSKDDKKRFEEDHFVRIATNEDNNRFYCNIEGTDHPSLVSFVILAAHFEYVKKMYDINKEELVELVTDEKDFLERGEL